MKFHCLLPVRDESDIIRQCLDHLLKWADAIYVFDTGSTDETWEIVQDVAGVDRRIVPLRKDPVYYCDCLLRGWMFNEARKYMQEGDWFLRVDADEFHHILPPEFVRDMMRPHETLAYHQYYEFVLRDVDVERWNTGMETVADRIKPIEFRRRWYYTYPYSEPRLCRYRSGMKWPTSVSFPHNAGFAARERLPIRHYPHRDPTQVAARSELRATMLRNRIENGELSAGTHWQKDWREAIRRNDDPILKEWKVGEVLPCVPYESHLSSLPKRLVQRLIHGSLLGVLDRYRTGWESLAYPRRIEK